MATGCPFGSHRSLDPPGSLPQAAWRLDNRPEPLDNEILVDVDTLNIDSASFTQIEREAGHDLGKIQDKIREIIETRGKMHNPATGSGGMLMGTIAKVGQKLHHVAKPGTRIATLVSLSLTPLKLGKRLEANPATDQVRVDAQAILFESGLWAALPDDLPEEVTLAALDVAGAAAQTARLVRPGEKVLIVGAGGKSGLLCSYEARRRVGPTGLVLGLEPFLGAREELERLGFCHHTLDADATQPLLVREQVLQATGGEEVDVVINCVNVPGTEMSCILPVRQGGKVYFFSMATSFTAAALGAEGAGKDVDMLVGNGYTRGHDVWTLQILRDCPPLRQLFEARYAPA